MRGNNVFLGAAEAARKLRIGVDRLYALIWSGKLLGQKVDGHWRISGAAVEERRRALSQSRRARVPRALPVAEAESMASER